MVLFGNLRIDLKINSSCHASLLILSMVMDIATFNFENLVWASEVSFFYGNIRSKTINVIYEIQLSIL